MTTYAFRWRSSTWVKKQNAHVDGWEMAEKDEGAPHHQAWDREELENFADALRQSVASTPSPPPNSEELEGQVVASPEKDLGQGSNETHREVPASAENEADPDPRASTSGNSDAGGRIQTAVAAFLPQESVRRLRGVLHPEDIDLLETPDLSTALDRIAGRRPEYVFTGLGFDALHSPSLIAALKACPSHRSLPIAAVTPADPRLLHLGLYRPDAVIGDVPSFESSTLEFLDEYRVPGRSTIRGIPNARWSRFDGRVLLVENSAMAHRILGKVLHVAGAHVTVAESTSEVTLVAVTREFDIVLLDLEMPEADEDKLVHFLRAALPDRPIVGLTSEECDPVDRGVDALLRKPVRRGNLFTLCSRLTRQKDPRALRTGFRRAG